MKQPSDETLTSRIPPICTHQLAVVVRPALKDQALERAARLFRALGDAPRLRILHLLLTGEVCVGEVVTARACVFFPPLDDFYGGDAPWRFQQAAAGGGIAVDTGKIRPPSPACRLVVTSEMTGFFVVSVMPTS